MRESSNQQSLEEEANDTTELGELAVALHEIQQAPVPVESTTSAPRTTSKRVPFITKRRFSTTSAPVSPQTTSPSRRTPIKTVKHRPQAFEKINPSVISTNTYRPLAEYDYYDDDTGGSYLAQIPEHSKVLLHSNGIIECLDQGNFPHPVSCKKFISCAKMENAKVLGWEYTCPINLSFDPIGGICNWSAGLGCNE